MRNTLGDLNNHLFAQLERLNDEDLKGDQLVEEINRAKAVTDVANQIIANGSLVLKAQTVYDDHLNADAKKPKLLEG
ncbi:hypothetical protein V2H29_01880 [Lysinibacillus fusiformis]|uniref:hypothetical protein n=1 Tax=Lysinibacillus TaxID=400634 RepID=UPI000738C164|nr:MULTISPECIES: hypothetical protein [unclassified Lysinibacillus]KUF29963.1 hypothetical protein AK833_18020 [Lysinibacillus sp. F5]MEE3805694.1 hypothetical protein [Lysinibacillus fusiformis]WCH46600.1 hypothetical protein NV349_16100 [Lysinibacillus sp. OF-1]